MGRSGDRITAAANTAPNSDPRPASSAPAIERYPRARNSRSNVPLGMSAFVGTPLEAVLRDRLITTLILVGAVLEIGIEPTARHAADLGFLPVVVTDACGVVEPAAGQRALESLDYTLMCYRCTSDEVAGAFRGVGAPWRLASDPADRQARLPAPLRGEHGREILREIGLEDRAIDDLAEESVIWVP